MAQETPLNSAMLIIVAGTIGRSGLGGQAWASMQYLAGLEQLGHDVYYLEDCGETSVAYDWERQTPSFDLSYPAAYVDECLTSIGMQDRWIYRAGDDSLGMPLPKFLEVCAETDLLLIRATPLWTWRAEYDRPRRRAYIDVDPGFTQFTLAGGSQALSEGLDRCETLFTYGQNIGAADCPIPTGHRHWIKTFPPVALPHWPVMNTQASHFTSVIRWKGFKEVAFQGATYGQRDLEFPKYLDLPRMVDQPLRMAALGADPNLLETHGWDFVHGEEVSRTPRAYRQFIQDSRGEFLVPKQGYVSSRSGWFSDRSVCYLASGRPVLVEDTGLDDVLPIGGGIVTFTDPDSAARGLDMINRDYASHSIAARQLAENLFSGDHVLRSLLDAALA